MTNTQIIITAVSALFFIVNMASSVNIIVRNKKFKEQKVILRLYSDSHCTVLFVVLSAIVVAALWFFYGFNMYVAFLSAAVLSGMVYSLMAQLAVCGLTDKALFVNGKIREWYTVYDFYIDKNRKIVIFSSNVKGGLTLKGITKPLRYKSEDEEKLEKYLESHMSKYFSKIVIR